MSGREDENNELIGGASVRTDKYGIAKITLDGIGKWYVKFIQMQKIKEPKLDYESKWATLTFAVK